MPTIFYLVRRLGYKSAREGKEYRSEAYSVLSDASAPLSILQILVSLN